MFVSAAASLPAQVVVPAFDVLYEEQVDAVWRLLERLGVPSFGLEDAVQEVFLIAHRKLTGFRGDSSVKTWLGGIAVRVAKDARRSHARKGSLERALQSDSAGTAPALSIDHSIDQQRALAHLLQLLEQLDEDQRTLFVCAELQEMTAPEIAAATGVNLNTVYTRLRAARQHFNALVAKAGSV